MITDDIPLPDPTVYRRMHTVVGDGTRWRVQAGRTAARGRTLHMRRVTVWEGHDSATAKLVCDEMQQRLSVARALLGLPV